ncbi:hypothetical protein ACJ41O_002838 [Fusarium nematophilum]
MWYLLWLCLAVVHTTGLESSQEILLDPNPDLYNFSTHDVLNYTGVGPGRPVKSGTKLRILCVGDSITLGSLSEQDGGDGDGYRRQLHRDLSKDQVVFAGTGFRGTMEDGYFAAWPGKTIQFISDNVTPSLAHRPNIILLHAGTNDMDQRPQLSREGSDPAGAADRLGRLIDQMIQACPDAVILVALIISTCDPNKASGTPGYQDLIPGVARERRNAGHRVLAVDFTTFPLDDLRDCIHPTNEGYRRFGNYWYDFVTQIPSSWIKEPVGDDPKRSRPDEGSAADMLVQGGIGRIFSWTGFWVLCWHAAGWFI